MLDFNSNTSTVADEIKDDLTEKSFPLESPNLFTSDLSSFFKSSSSSKSKQALYQEEPTFVPEELKINQSTETYLEDGDSEEKDFTLNNNLILDTDFGWLGSSQTQIHSSIALPGCVCSSCCSNSVSNFEFTDTANDSNSNLSPLSAVSTGDYRINALLADKKWVGNTITYSFFDGGYYYGAETAWEVSDTIKNSVRYILENIIEPFINVDFVEVSDAGNNYGTLRYMLSNGPDYAYAYSPNNSSVGGDVHLNPNQDNAWTSGSFQGGFGSHGFMTLIHETLHAIGLKHPGNYNGSGTGEGPFLPYGEDNTTNTVMSYNSAGNSASSMMPYDILALQYLYGASNHNSGNTTYTFDSVFGFSDGTQYWGNSNPIYQTKLSIWDSSGIDVLNFSKLGYSSSGYVFDLNEGGMLTTGSAYNATPYQARDGQNLVGNYSTTTYGTALGYDTTIENAIGSSSNDLIVGNEVANNLQGNNGADIIFGNNGNDTLIGGSGNDTLNGNEGNDSLEGEAGRDRLNGGGGKDTLNGGADQDTLTGGGGDDVLSGGDDVDILKGGNGTDILFGGDSNDILFGNGGTDYFLLASGQGRDTIRDFADGIDFFAIGNGLTYDDLTIRNHSQGIGAIIRDNNNNALALVRNVDAALITESDFFEF